MSLGRPSKYKPEYIEQARKLCRLGATDCDLAYFFEVSLEDIAAWAWDYQEFFDAITPTIEQLKHWKIKEAARKQQRNAANRKRRANSIHERIGNSMRARMWAALRGKTSGMCLHRLGYSIHHLKEYLESKFLEGMSWDNYGAWHIDHIKPCSLFDQSDESQFKECWSLSNLQPLWASDNIRKSNRYAGS